YFGSDNSARQMNLQRGVSQISTVRAGCQPVRCAEHQLAPDAHRWARIFFRDNFSLKEMKTNSTKLISAATLLLLVSFACLAQDKGTGAIKGKVRVEKGSPAGAAVILRQADHEVTRVTTDKKGDFLIAHIAPGIYGLTVRKPGLAVGSVENIEVKGGKTRALGDRLILSVDEGSIAFIRGSVFNEDGRSVRGVRVELSRIIDEQSTEKIDARVTGETGEFVFRLPPDAAKYRLTVKTDGAQLDSRDVTVDGAAIYRIALTFKPVPK
ncbi:MAG: carboxypeptidase regulatory-like domain-containing protein, partial [Acidobacteriota bacterium]